MEQAMREKTHGITSLSSHCPHLLFLLFPLLIAPSEWHRWRRRIRSGTLILCFSVTAPLCSGSRRGRGRRGILALVLVLLGSIPIHLWWRSGLYRLSPNTMSHIPFMRTHLLMFHPPSGSDASEDEPDESAWTTTEVMIWHAVVVGVGHTR